MAGVASAETSASHSSCAHDGIVCWSTPPSPCRTQATLACPTSSWCSEHRNVTDWPTNTLERSETA